MSRRAFIESTGASCKNWRWSWAFVNHGSREVIFGAWDVTQQGEKYIILQDDWMTSEKGRKQPAYGEAAEYVELVQVKQYSLRIFPMIHAPLDRKRPGGTSTIVNFSPNLIMCNLVRGKGRWIAIPIGNDALWPDETSIDIGPDLFEGGRRAVTVSAVERNAEARSLCLKWHGYRCKVCGIDFGEKYGELGEGFIHVHHLKPLASITQRRPVDPKVDLIPVCPNCHAMLHRRTPPFAVEEICRALVEAKDVP